MLKKMIRMIVQKLPKLPFASVLRSGTDRGPSYFCGNFT